MAKFYGYLGYATDTVETKPYVYKPGEIVEKQVVGNILKNGRNLETSNNINPNVNLDVKISFIADPYASEHYHSIKYVKFRDENVKWEVKSIVSINYPRLVLTLGGVYNG